MSKIIDISDGKLNHRHFKEQLQAVIKSDRDTAIAHAVDVIIPLTYASIGLALHNLYGHDKVQIEKVFEESQKIIEEYTGRPADLIQTCERVMGCAISGLEV